MQQKGRKLNFTVDQIWNIVPDGNGDLHLIHRSELFDPEIEGRFDATADVIFLLRTQANRDGERIILGDSGSLSSSNFNPSIPTRFVIHGWNNEASSDVNQYITNAYLDVGAFNVIVVDWGAGANTINYISARNYVNQVGPVVARFINEAVSNNGLRLSDVHIIGHSLGGHTAGIAGKHVDGLVNTIIALDPAGPLFYYDVVDERVHSGDAEYVEIIHTNGWTLGFGDSIGDSDFYPNGGASQPGCGWDLVGTCAHSRSYQFLAESILGHRFVAVPCLMNEVDNGNCSPGGDSVLMGGEPSNHGRNVYGIFHLTTNEESPFAQG